VPAPRIDDADGDQASGTSRPVELEGHRGHRRRRGRLGDVAQDEQAAFCRQTGQSVSGEQGGQLTDGL
jgi:hypothetical protein